MAGKLLIAGFVLLFIGGLVFLKFLNSENDTPSVSQPTAPEAAGSGQPAMTARTDPPAANEPTGRATPSARMPLKPRNESSRPAVAETTMVPSSDEIQYRPDGVPIAVADLDVLRAATPPTDNLVRDCIAKHGGAAVSGTLITTFIVARKREADGTFSVHTETTGFEEEGSTITDPELVDCLHKTALQMKYPTSTSPVATWARRSIVVDNGTMGENWVFRFGYIR